MGRSVLWIFLVLVVVAIAGLFFLASADLEAPTARVEKVLPNAPPAP